MRNANSFILTICVLIISTLILPAQLHWTSYSHTINTKEYQGLNFRLHSSIRAEVEDDEAAAGMWARVDISEKEVGFFYNMHDRPVVKPEWETYTIEGTIDTNSYQMVFGALTYFNGNFYYDNFSLEIELEEGKWVTIYTEDFEGENYDFIPGINKGQNGINNLFEATITHDKYANYGNVLTITGKSIPNYGVNNKAGNYAKVNDLQLYYEIYGEGQPLLVLLENGMRWNGPTHFPHFIEKGYQVIGVDIRGIGKSKEELKDQDYTFDLYASDIDLLLEKLKLDSVYVWGQGFGAMTGIYLAKNHPGRVKKLLANTVSLNSDTTGILPEIYHEFDKYINSVDDPQTKKLLNLAYLYTNVPLSDLHKVQAEVLLLFGDRDVVKLEHINNVFKNLPKANLCIMPGTTMLAPEEKKDLFFKIVDDFFESEFKMLSSIDLIR